MFRIIFIIGLILMLIPLFNKIKDYASDKINQTKIISEGKNLINSVKK